MLPKEKIDRINDLSRKSRSVGLTEEERQEQLDLREEYLDSFRKTFEEQLKSIEIVDVESDN